MSAQRGLNRMDRHPKPVGASGGGPVVSGFSLPDGERLVQATLLALTSSAAQPVRTASKPSVAMICSSDASAALTAIEVSPERAITAKAPSHRAASCDCDDHDVLRLHSGDSCGWPGGATCDTKNSAIRATPNDYV